MQARTRSSDAAPQDIVGRVELTVSAEVTGHYSRESRQRAGPRTGVIEEHVDEKASVTMAGASQWSIKSQAGFEDVFFRVEPGKFTTSTNGQGRFNETKTHSDLCFAGVDSPRQERWSTDSHDMMWTLRSGSPAAPGADAASALNHLAVTRDTADPDRGAYLLGLSIPIASPAVAGQETQTGRLCGETTPQNSNLTDTPIGDGGAFTIVTNTLNLAMQDAAFTADLAGTFDRHTRGFSVTRHAVFNFAPKDDVFDNVEAADDVGIRSREHREGVLDLTYTVTYYVESDVDAVIEPGAEYVEWMPEAADGAYEPRPLEVHVRLHRKGAPGASASEPARFRFELVGTSREPGFCLNAWNGPDPDFSPPPDESFDLMIGEKDNPTLKISNWRQRAETKDGLTDATVLINPDDWGGYTRLKVTAILKDGTEIVAHLAGGPERHELRVPIDDNNNHIADGWEKSEGILERALPANWNEAGNPAGQLAAGDGISLYEKYRGFDFDGRHERLKPAKKYLFLFDEDGVYKQVFARPETAGLDFASLSGLEVRLIAEYAWTGSGAATEGHRIINFNHRTGHAVDEHGVHITTSSPTPAGALGWARRDGPMVFGPPRATIRVTIDQERIGRQVMDTPATLACALPRPGGPLPFPACASDAIADAYYAEHGLEIQEMFGKYLAITITHELGHAVGVRHHDAVGDGDHQCVMRYFKLEDCNVAPEDPVQLKCRSPWPSKLVGPDPRSFAAMGCFQQIVVDDAKYK